jgi:hypothetical protein
MPILTNADIDAKMKSDKSIRKIDDRYQRFTVVQWGAVKKQVLEVLRHNKPWPSQPINYGQLNNIKRNMASEQSWVGNYIDEQGNHKTATGFDIMSWVDRGFYSSAFRNLAARTPVGLQHRATWNEEEGDIDISRLYGGWDDYMLGPVRQPGKPGIRVQFEYAFAAGVPNETIAAYGVWIMKLITGMEQQGFDIAIDAWICLDDLFRGDEGGYQKRRRGRGWQYLYESPRLPTIRSNVLVRVKNVGEASDPTEWSVMFSPAGYRVCGFTAKGVAGDKIGKTTTGGLGMTIGGKDWSLHYDKEKALVTIFCNQRAGYGYGHAFPAETLTKQAIEAGLLPDINSF